MFFPDVVPENGVITFMVTSKQTKIVKCSSSFHSRIHLLLNFRLPPKYYKQVYDYRRFCHYVKMLWKVQTITSSDAGRSFWKHVNSKRWNHAILKKMVFCDSVANTLLETANLFAKYFRSV